MGGRVFEHESWRSIAVSERQWWVALGLAGMIVLMQFYDRAKPIYDGWKSQPAQPQAKRK
jgi:hypothetical protein